MLTEHLLKEERREGRTLLYHQTECAGAVSAWEVRAASKSRAEGGFEGWEGKRTSQRLRPCRSLV